MQELRPVRGTDIKTIWPRITLPGGKGAFIRLALGNGTAYTIGLQWVLEDGEDALLVSVIDKGAYTFSRDIHYSYAREKLGILKWDAQNLADFLNVQLGLAGKPQGEYMKSCLS